MSVFLTDYVTHTHQSRDLVEKYSTAIRDALYTQLYCSFIYIYIYIMTDHDLDILFITETWPSPRDSLHIDALNTPPIGRE